MGKCVSSPCDGNFSKIKNTESQLQLKPSLKNIVATGFKSELLTESTLQKKQYFRQFGKICTLQIIHTVSPPEVYVSYATEVSAARAMEWCNDSGISCKLIESPTCKCGMNLNLVHASKCKYRGNGSRKKRVGPRCHDCGNPMHGQQAVFHCDGGQSMYHENGFDLCYDCGSRRIAKEPMKELERKYPQFVWDWNLNWNKSTFFVWRYTVFPLYRVSYRGLEWIIEEMSVKIAECEWAIKANQKSYLSFHTFVCSRCGGMGILSIYQCHSITHSPPPILCFI